jgi:hypothetical protein
MREQAERGSVTLSHSHDDRDAITHVMECTSRCPASPRADADERD